MSRHAKVVEVIPIWNTQKPRTVLRLELPSGKRIDCPDLGVKPGEIVAVLTEDEHRLIETYRANVPK